MVKKILLTITIVAFSMSIFAQVEEVTLTVSGDGATKTEATQLALRSAIEQAFGVFVSANTQILNDELVKDEIAAVSSGNIKNYEEIATVTLPNGNTSVTLKAVVSISKLISYAQSKGSSAEFAGATFGMNMKLKELNKANEEKVIANMISLLEKLAPTMFDYELKLGEPEQGRNPDIYVIPTTINVVHSNNTEIVNSILLKTLNSVSLSIKEYNECKTLKLPVQQFVIGIKVNSNAQGNWLLTEMKCFNLRSELSKRLLIYYVENIFEKAINNYKIVGNSNNIPSVEPVGLTLYDLDFLPRYMVPSVHLPVISLQFCGYATIPHIRAKLPKNKVHYELKANIIIPKDDIMKYNNFTITHK